MQLAEVQVRQISAWVWASILHTPLDVAESADARELDPSSEAGVLTACVQIAGGWQGAVCLSCVAEFAARAAAVMFGVDTAATSEADMQDALGELANMIGGNIKGLLPEPCHLSMPTVVHGNDYSLRIPRSTVSLRVPFTCEGLPVQIVLREREADIAVAA